MVMIKRAYIDLELCEQSRECNAKKHCGKEAIDYDEGQLYVNQLCNGCRKCKEHCVKEAIKII